MNPAWVIWVYLVGVAFAAAVVLVLLSFSSKSRLKRRERFCRDELCQLDSTYAAQFDRRSDQALRINAATIAITGALAAAIPPTVLAQYGGIAFTLGYGVSSAASSMWQALAAPASFDAMDAPVALARSRAVTLADFIPSRLRMVNRISAALAILLALTALTVERFGALLPTPGTVVVVAACMFPVGIVIFSELVGSRLSDLPEPAVSAGHLYAQDAFRSSRLQDVFRLNMWATLLLWFGSGNALLAWSYPDVWNPWTAFVGPFGLMAIGSVLLYLQLPFYRSRSPWFRHRLWPTLEPGQILKPGDELPERPRAHA